MWFSKQDSALLRETHRWGRLGDGKLIYFLVSSPHSWLIAYFGRRCWPHGLTPAFKVIGEICVVYKQNSENGVVLFDFCVVEVVHCVVCWMESRTKWERGI